MVIPPLLHALTHISCIVMCSLKSLTAVLGRGTPTNCEVLVSWLGACALWWGWSHLLIMMRCRTPGSWPGAIRNVACCCCSLLWAWGSGTASENQLSQNFNINFPWHCFWLHKTPRTKAFSPFATLPFLLESH